MPDLFCKIFVYYLSQKRRLEMGKIKYGIDTTKVIRNQIIIGILY